MRTKISLSDCVRSPLTPVTVFVAQQYLEKLGFVDLINDHVAWDAKQWQVSPGVLAESVVLSTFMTNCRSPLYRIASLYEGMDTELLFGPGVKAEYLNDDAIGQALDRIYEAKGSYLFSNLALSSYTTFAIPFGDTLHADTTSHVLYGDYAACEDPDYEGLDVTYGYSKDHRPDLKQVMSGLVCTSQGIPLYHQTLDGNHTDCVWNGETIVTLRDVLGDRFDSLTYIADSKLINKKNLAVLNDPAHPVRFISRCPDSFATKIAEKVRQKAYFQGNWQLLGNVAAGPIAQGDEDHFATYWSQSFTETIEGQNYRLVVYRSSSGRERVERKLTVERAEWERAIAGVQEKFFACEPDAIAVALDLAKRCNQGGWMVRWKVAAHTVEKRSRGNPGKQPKPPEIQTTWQVCFTDLQPDPEKVKRLEQKSESFVLMTNHSAEQLDDREILRRYKEQRVVEVEFHLLKQPSMASRVFLKKPERIEALLMLLHVALLVRALLQTKVREKLQHLPEIPRLDFDNKPLRAPTAEKVLLLLAPVTIVTEHPGRYHYSHSGGKALERLRTLLDLAGLGET